MLLGAVAVASAPAPARAQLGEALAPPAAVAARLPGAASELGDPSEAPAAREPAPAAAPRGWAVDLLLSTSVPLSVGGEVQVESPVGVFANLHLGYTPPPYMEMVAGLLAGEGVLVERAQPAVQDGIAAGAVAFRVGLGYRIIEGLEISMGYTLLHVETALSADTVEAAAGRPLPPGTSSLPMAIDVHAFHATLGYRLVLEEHLVLRLAVGWSHSFTSEVGIDVPDNMRMAGGVIAEVAQGIRDALGQYGFSPELQVGVGYRF